MAQLLDLLDARYQEVGVENHRMAPMRLVIALALTSLAAIAVDLRLAVLWFALVLAGELLTLVVTRPLLRGAVDRKALATIFFSGLITVPIWAGYGLLLWTGPTLACSMAAVSYWGGSVLYTQSVCTKSPMSTAMTGIPTLACAIFIPLLFPKFHGLDQVVVISLMALGVAHAVSSALRNLNNAGMLEAANRGLVAGKQAAEAAQADMALAKAEADAANQAKSAFLATMSHEIRTPLNGVLGMTQAMAMDRLSEPQRERLEVVRASGEALLAILNDLLDLSKIEAGKLTLETIDFDFSEVVQGAYQAFTALANKKGLSFRLDIAEAEGIYRGDPTRVRQVLYNLISNALKFTSQGEIAVRAESVADRLRLIISDTGEGISQANLANLFTKFTQADSTTTRRFGGTGLGLAICAQLADLMDGRVEAQSEEGVGSTFTVTLGIPRVGAARPSPMLPSPDAAPAYEPVQGVRVLAAEDNKVNQLVLKTLLHNIGVDPVVVENGALALEAWESEPWDLILMDISMPVMDGPTAVSLIRAREVETGRARTPILALTANSMTHQIAEYLQGGMDGHVAKPIEAGKLFAALNAALEPDETGTELERVA